MKRSSVVNRSMNEFPFSRQNRGYFSRVPSKGVSFVILEKGANLENTIEFSLVSPFS